MAEMPPTFVTVSHSRIHISVTKSNLPFYCPDTIQVGYHWKFTIGNSLEAFYLTRPSGVSPYVISELLEIKTSILLISSNC